MSTVKTWLGFTIVGLFGVLGLARPAGAVPVKYQLTMSNATVQLGAQTYANVPVAFTFEGDDSNAISGTTPSGFVGVPDIHYAFIYQGTASVTVTPTGGAPITAVFSPNQIVVSVDQQNGGLGFGFYPGGVPASGFDVTQFQPVYPGGVSCYSLLFPGCIIGSGWDYTLTLASSTALSVLGVPFFPDGSVDAVGAVYSCYDFNGSIFTMSCGTPAPIQTNLGAFTIAEIAEPTTVGSQGLPLVTGEFTAKAAAPPMVPFSGFGARLDISGTSPGQFEINSSFVLGTGSNGINPLAEVVTLLIGSYSVMIPQGSFTQTAKAAYVYGGTISGTALEVRIAPVGANSYTFKAEGRGAKLAGTTNPVTVGLTIGDDAGTTMVNAEFESGH